MGKYGFGIGGAAGIEVRTCCDVDNMLYREYLLVIRLGPSFGGSGRISPSGLINLIRIGQMATCMANPQGNLGPTGVDIQIGNVVTSTDLSNLRTEIGLTPAGGPAAASAVLNLASYVYPWKKQPLNKKCCPSD
jgi:hypothetical protein